MKYRLAAGAAALMVGCAQFPAVAEEFPLYMALRSSLPTSVSSGDRIPVIRGSSTYWINGLAELTNQMLSVSGGILKTGSGDTTAVYGTSSPTVWGIYKGSSGSPITTAGQQLRIQYWHNLNNTQCGGNSADTGCNSPILVNAIGGATTSMVTSAATFYARGSSTVALSDIQAVNGIGDVTGSGVGIGTGGYFQGRTYTATGKALGAEISAANYSASDYCTINTVGLSNCDGVWTAARGLSGYGLSVAYHVGTGDGLAKWRAAYVVNSNAMSSASGTITYDDEGSAETAFKIGGTHTYGLKSSATSGFWGFGTMVPAARVHIAGDMSSADWAGTGIALRQDGATYTITGNPGTVSFSAISALARPTIAASNPTTVSTANTLYIAGCPIAGTNITIASACWALNTAGPAFFNALVSMGGSLLVAGNTDVSGTVSTGGYTVAGLPAGAVGMRTYVTDQTGSCPNNGGAFTNGGSSVCPAFYNGSAWVGG